MAPKKTQSPSASTNPPPSDDESCIMLECDRALTTLQHGNHARALKLIKESFSRRSSSNVSNQHSAILHRTIGEIYYKTASLIDDSKAKHKHLKNAAESARQARTLSQNSVSFALFYADVLFELAANYGENGYQEVIQECERALMIEDPEDPLKNCLFQEEEIPALTSSSREWRIENVKQQLRKLIEKCKNVGDGERREESKSVVEVKNNPPRQTDEEIKALQERRKEVEPRVMEERLLQQKKLATFASPSRDDTVQERRKYANPKRILSNVDRMVQVKTYWKDTLNVEKKRVLLKTGIKELKTHFSKNIYAKKVLKEAIDFAKEENKWKFWVCCCCGERFRDSELYMQHIKNGHIGHLSEMLEANVPEVVSDECIKLVENFVWKPLDLLASGKIIENQSRFGSCDVRDSNPTDKDSDESKGCSSIDKEDDAEVFRTEIYENQTGQLCDDSKRTEILERIRDVFHWLLRHKYLAERHLLVITGFTLETLKTRIPELEIANHGLDKTLLSICFLEAPHLEEILQFFEELCGSCALSYLSEDSISDDELKGAQAFCIKERIAFSSDLSSLLLDERLLRGELIPSTYQDAVADDGTAVTSAVDIRENDELPDSDAFINWLLTGPAIGDQLEAWASLREAGKNQGMEFFQILEKEYNCLQNMLKTKAGLISDTEVLQDLETICLEEDKKREQISECDRQSYASLLLKLQKELERNVDAVTDTFELSIINSKLETVSRILKEEQADTCIKMTIQKQKVKQYIEIFKVDPIILAIKAIIRQTELKLGVVSAYDYRSIMVHLLKSFMQAHLENLVDKDATEKSDAAIEAFLAELTLDANKSMKDGCDNVRKIQAKSKDKKKKKDRKRAKDNKATSGSEEHLPLHHEKAEQVCFPITHDEPYPNPEIGVSVSTDELKQQEEEHILETRYEEEERMLDEALEYQIRIENEAKQKHLSEQNKETGGTVAENVTESLVYSKRGENDGFLNQQQLVKQFIRFGSFHEIDFSHSHSDAQSIEEDEKSSKHEQLKPSEPSEAD